MDEVAKNLCLSLIARGKAYILPDIVTYVSVGHVLNRGHYELHNNYHKRLRIRYVYKCDNGVVATGSGEYTATRTSFNRIISAMAQDGSFPHNAKIIKVTDKHYVDMVNTVYTYRYHWGLLCRNSHVGFYSNQTIGMAIGHLSGLSRIDLQ